MIAQVRPLPPEYAAARDIVAVVLGPGTRHHTGDVRFRPRECMPAARDRDA